MNNNCPNCSTDLKLKLMKTVAASNESLLKSITERAVACPNCQTLLKSTPHPFDNKIQRYLLLPAVFLPIGIVLKQEFIFYLSGVFFLISISYVVYKITRIEYKKWKVWSLYNEKI